MKNELVKTINDRTPQQQKAFERCGADYVVRATVSSKNRKFTDFFFLGDNNNDPEETIHAGWKFVDSYEKLCRGSVRRSVKVVPATSVKEIDWRM